MGSYGSGPADGQYGEDKYPWVRVFVVTMLVGYLLYIFMMKVEEKSMKPTAAPAAVGGVLAEPAGPPMAEPPLATPRRPAGPKVDRPAGTQEVEWLDPWTAGWVRAATPAPRPGRPDLPYSDPYWGKERETVIATQGKIENEKKSQEAGNIQPGDF